MNPLIINTLISASLQILDEAMQYSAGKQAPSLDELKQQLDTFRTKRAKMEEVDHSFIEDIKMKVRDFIDSKT